ncbi:MAG: DUF5606 domain-containing protein [Bacteroidaceae bacterium]|nr:DUF5606 domain-containing protein [Bacteroidaceae bacterium]MBR6589190.1 DUF5606 domain-containing protein [Bacteroidaceae bacterium]
MLRTILSISGKPGLYKLISRGKNMLIVEALDATQKRQPVHGTDKVISLGDIAMYTDDEEVPLRQVFANVKAKEEGKPATIDPKKASANELHEYMAAVLPNYDRDRVYNNDIKKLITWYNILVNNNMADFEDSTEEATTDESAE